MAPGYEKALGTVRSALSQTPLVGRPVYAALHGLKRGLKDFLQPQVLFEDLGLKYVGPIDGHDVAAMEAALKRAKEYGGPVIVHAVTVKGFGYQPAVDDEADCLHSVGIIDPVTGKPVADRAPRASPRCCPRRWSAIGGERPDVVALTAAMLQPVGLHAFSEAYPDRIFDVGIAEQHAVTSRRRPGDRRHAPGRLPLRHVPQPGLRPGAHGRRAARPARHLRARPRRHHR